MLKVQICRTDGAVIAEGTCSDSGYFPLALSSIYNAGLNLVPARSLEGFGEGHGSAEYPVGTRRATFGHSPRGHDGRDRILDDEVVVHVEPM
ncbi:MAG TPA: hypothetical protein VFH48_03805 [Chloroflexota bacterium]|nr:hypothetical protein [Chloroflexota bacterium]